MPRKRDNLIKTRFIGVRQHINAQRRPTGWYELSAKRNHPRKPGKKWNLRVMVQAPNAEDASRQRADAIKAFLEGQSPRSLPSVRTYSLSWLKLVAPTVKKSTRATYGNSVAEINAALGDFDLELLRVDDVEAWRESFKLRRKPNGEPYSPDTWNQHRRTGRALYNAAIERFKPRLVSNPFALSKPMQIVIDVESVDPDEFDPSKAMSAEQLGALVEQLRLDAEARRSSLAPTWHALALVHAYTGARFGEPTALKWPDVRFSGREIVFSKRQYRGDVDTLKTSTRKKIKVKRGPLPDDLANVLRELQREQFRKQRKGIESGLVFLGRDGKPVSNSGFNEALKRAAKRAGLDIEPTSHWFRHTLKSLMDKKRIDKTVTKAITGWTTDEMYEHYGDDVSTERKLAAVEKVVLPVVLSARRAGAKPKGDQ